MTGKEKCELLKRIRKEIADRNGIAFEPAKCNFSGDCYGTCPKCDEEIRYLDAQLNKKAEMGGKVHVAGIRLDEVNVQNESPFSPSMPPFPGGGRRGMDIDGHVYTTMGLIRPTSNLIVTEDEDDDYNWD